MKIAHIPVTLILFLALGFIPAKSHSDDMLRRIEPFLTAVNDGLNELDSELTKIEQQASIVPGNERIDTIMDDVAKAGSEALRALIEATQDADKARIAESYPRAFAEFEKVAQAFRSRAGNIADRLVAIQTGIAEGRIVVAVDVFDQSTARERVDFMKVLTPKAQDMYRKMSPAKFSSLDFHLQKFGMRFGKAVKDACIPDANALIAASCVSLCAGTGGTACVACVGAAVAAGSTATYLYFKNGYESCLRSCCGCRWYKPWCCGCKAGCFLAWAAFIA